jgi:orotidine-5'-phosphate decarboxylase
VQRLNNTGAFFATMHGNNPMLKAAAQEKGETKILAVTVLTSPDKPHLEDLGFQCDSGSAGLIESHTRATGWM